MSVRPLFHRLVELRQDKGDRLAEIFDSEYQRQPNQNINGSPRRWWPGGLELQIHWRMKAHNTRQLKL